MIPTDLQRRRPFLVLFGAAGLIFLVHLASTGVQLRLTGAIDTLSRTIERKETAAGILATLPGGTGAEPRTGFSRSLEAIALEPDAAAPADPGSAPSVEGPQTADPATGPDERDRIAARIAATIALARRDRAALESWRDGFAAAENALLLITLFGIATAVILPLQRRILQAEARIAGLERELDHAARHDALTGLPNRRYVEEHLHRVLAAASRSGQAVALLHIDIDGFSDLNDRLGSQQGDAVLAKVARVLEATIRKSDFLGRTGGDDFLVIAPDSRNPRGIERFAARLAERIAEPLSIAGREIAVTASIGVALAPPLATDAEQLSSAADQALREAKADPTAAFRFHPDAQTYLEVNYPLPRAMVLQSAIAG